MSRVLLFTQQGSERPKAAIAPAEWAEHPKRVAAHMAAWRGRDPSRVPPFRTSLQRVLCANRWWLCECENADAGREIIEESRRRDAGASYYEIGNLGRILASGEKP